MPLVLIIKTHAKGSRFQKILIPTPFVINARYSVIILAMNQADKANDDN